MTPVALALVVVAAFLHPTWNLLARRATGVDTATFVWTTSALSAALYVPVVLALALAPATHARLRDAPLDLGMMAGTGVLHQIYFVLLQRGYRSGAFSIVYPLARGTGPVFASFGALAFFGEAITWPHAFGLALVLVAIAVVTGGRAAPEPSRRARGTLRASVAYGVATGASIAAYTLWDKQAVSGFAIAPVVYDFGRTASQALLFCGPVLGVAERRRAIGIVWRDFRREALGVAVLSPAAYVLVLYALTVAPVGVVAPLREIGIVIGAFIGAHVLREGQARRRLIAAALMLCGTAALAVR